MLPKPTPASYDSSIMRKHGIQTVSPYATWLPFLCLFYLVAGATAPALLLPSDPL
ncbi:hypothetical protein JNM87_01995 [Candidatus Saccharibacteria bacterium]|nr:hypothetical protein [Candidatus Saccharibacteria bacterium]